MYAVSNKDFEDIKAFLAAFKSIPAEDNKMFNLQRRAGITLKKLAKSEKMDKESINRAAKSRP